MTGWLTSWQAEGTQRIAGVGAGSLVCDNVAHTLDDSISCGALATFSLLARFLWLLILDLLHTFVTFDGRDLTK